MKTRTAQLCTVGMILALLTGMSFAQPPQGPGPQGDPNDRPDMRRGDRPHHSPLLRCLHQIDLTDEQKDQIETILENNKDGTDAARAAVRDAKQALGAAIDSDDTAAIQAAAADLGTAIGNRAVQRVSVASAVKAVLTADQLAELEELKEKAKKWMKDGKFKRGKRKPCRCNHRGPQNSDRGGPGGNR